MTNCIFVTVFHQEQYVDMLFLLLESLCIWNDNTHLLIYTSTPFMHRIQKSHLFVAEKMKFEINDTYASIDSACKARLDLFQLPSISHYDKVLYLDTDIIVKGDVRNVFDVCVDDGILYVLEEGEIDSDTDFWGKTLFGAQIHEYEDKTAFTSGILLFMNSDKMQGLFSQIREDMVQRYYPNSFNDQPYIVYNAFKNRAYNNKLLKSWATNNDNNISSDKVIHHFPGGPGLYAHKLHAMRDFLYRLKDATICEHIATAKQYIDTYLMHIIRESGELLEGNIFMFHNTSQYTDAFLNKTKNICSLVLNKNIKHVMEIGFNSGFSTLLMLLSNPTMRITCFDLGEHRYTLPCFQQLKNTFGDRIDIVIGDSTKTLPSANGTYDLIHIDGGHSTEVASSDITNAYRLSKQGTILIMDDYDFPNLHQLWNAYIPMLGLKPLDIQLYPSPHHDIKYV